MAFESASFRKHLSIPEIFIEKNALKGCNRYQYQGFDSSGMFVRVICTFLRAVFSISMSCKYFHVRSNLSLICFEYFLKKKLIMLKEIKYQKQI